MTDEGHKKKKKIVWLCVGIDVNEVKMENCKITFCMICSIVITDENLKLKEGAIEEVLNVLQLKVSVDKNHELIICNTCTEKLFAAFNFKKTCMDTEDSIFPYIDSENANPVDLKEIYPKIRGKEHLNRILDNERICRLCMQIITCGFTSPEEIKFDLMRKYIPEINLNSTKEPVICSLCVDLLNMHYSFLKNCLDVQEKIKNVDGDCSTERTFCIKSEKIEVKEEDCDEYGDTFLQCDELVDSEIMNRDDPTFYGSKRKKNPLIKYKCDKCDFKTKYKIYLINHQLKHKDFSEVQVYKCDACDFKTKYKEDLTRHQVKHKNSSEEQVYKCVACDYRTWHKHCLTQHQLTHKDSSEVQLYKCDTCDFKTKFKYRLKPHQLIHKPALEVKKHKCDACDYRTYYKCTLLSHQRKHKDISEVRVYKCDVCAYRSRYNDNLKGHKLKHKDIAEVQSYKCNECNFKTKYKGSLTNHQLVHKTFSEVEVYKCDECDYKAKKKSYLINHQMTHEKLRSTYASVM